jgi:hypothetical protein
MSNTAWAGEGEAPKDVPRLRAYFKGTSGKLRAIEVGSEDVDEVISAVKQWARENKFPLSTAVLVTIK